MEEEGGDRGGGDGVAGQFSLPGVEGGFGDEAVELADGVGKVKDAVLQDLVY